MCFPKPPKQASAPPVPSKEAEDAKRRRANEAAASEQQAGREATIITSPLGVSSFGEDVKRTKLGGF
ncbi:MAG: hypothetical protein WBA88_15925 [Pseudaminobacter sp.]